MLHLKSRDDAKELNRYVLNRLKASFDTICCHCIIQMYILLETGGIETHLASVTDSRLKRVPHETWAFDKLRIQKLQ